MPFAAVLSTASSTSRAVDDVCAGIAKQLPGAPHLALVFFSPHHADQAQTIASTLSAGLQPAVLVGCMGESIVGGDQEIEHQPALSLWAARWAKPADLEAFHLVAEHTPDGLSLLGLPDTLIGADCRQLAMLVLGDPFTFRVDLLLQQANEDHKGLRVLGGMASGVRGPGECRLVLGQRVLTAGAVGVLLHGTTPLRCIVSQGCRPVGHHMVVTAGHDNLITELGGKPPAHQLQAVWKDLGPRDQVLFQQGPHLGLVMNEYQGEFRRGDFLVRNIYGLESNTGALVITDRIRVGQTVQFHVRDGQTADEDLRALLKQDLQAHPGQPAGALLFTCNGRGSRLFTDPNHDAGVICAEAGPLPLAGFFAQGELGPVGGQNFIHGYTASVVLFEE